MGGFFVSVHARVDSSEPVKAALSQLPGAYGYITQPKQGWVSVYESRCSDQDGEWIAQVTQQISKQIKGVAVAYLIHDGDFLEYWLCDRGKLIDRYNSVPDYFGDRPSAELKKIAGQPAKLLAVCKAGTSLKQVKAIFGEGLDCFDKRDQLANLLGIDTERSDLDYGNLSKAATVKSLRAERFGTKPSKKSVPEATLAPAAAAAFSQASAEFDRFLQAVQASGKQLTKLSLKEARSIQADLAKTKKTAASRKAPKKRSR